MFHPGFGLVALRGARFMLRAPWEKLPRPPRRERSSSPPSGRRTRRAGSPGRATKTSGWQDLAPARRALVAMARAIAEGDGARGSRSSSPTRRRSALARAALARRSRSLPPRPLRRHLAARHRADLRARRRRARSARRASGSTAGAASTCSSTTTRSRRASRGSPGCRRSRCRWILEGGAVDVDGEGTVLTTRQCLLNPNRNRRDGRRRAIEAGLGDALGVERVLWLGDGLAQRPHRRPRRHRRALRAPGRRRARWSRARADDPNRDALHAHRCASSRRAPTRTGGSSRSCASPPPGASSTTRGASCRRATSTSTSPTRASSSRRTARRGTTRRSSAIGALFPGRRAVGVDARAVLTGGGAFHCITQQQPGRAGTRDVSDADELSRSPPSSARSEGRATRTSRASSATCAMRRRKERRSSCRPSSSRGRTSAARRAASYFAEARPLEEDEAVARLRDVAHELGVVVPGLVLRARRAGALQQRRRRRRRRLDPRRLPQEPHPRRPRVRGEVLLPPRRHGLSRLEDALRHARRRHLLGPVVPRVARAR